MFDLNPLANPDAWWQHLVMITITIVLGYMIGHLAGKATIDTLEDELAVLEMKQKELKRSRTV